MDTRTIFFIGKPGCGKGTQAKLLSEKTGWKVVSASKELKAIAADNSFLGRKVKSEMDAGILVPYWFVAHIYLKTLFSLHEDDGAIFDGFSRKPPEAEVVIDSMKWIRRHFTILNINVSDEEVEKRLALRKEIEGRADDDALDERLKEYREYTEPAIDLFRKEGVLIEINGEQTPEAIAVDICAALNIK